MSDDTRLRTPSEVIRDFFLEPDGAGWWSHAVAFLLGAAIPLPLWFTLSGAWVRGLQVSLVYTAVVALVAATAVWWVDAIEQHEIERVLRLRREEEGRS